MANYPVLFLNPTTGRPERLLPVDGGLEIDVIDCAAAGSAVQLFPTVDGTGTVEILAAYTGVANFGAAGGTTAFLGAATVAQAFTATGAALFDSTVTLGHTNTTKYIYANQAGVFPAIRYNHTTARWEFSDTGGAPWYALASAGSTWDSIYANGETLDISDVGLVWSQTGSNKGVAFTVQRNLAAGVVNGALVSFIGTGDYPVLNITNISDQFSIDANLDAAALSAQGLIVRATAAHTATSSGFEVYTNGATVWKAQLNGDQAMSGDLTLTAGGLITTTANGNLSLVPHGSGALLLDCPDAAPADGTLAASEVSIWVDEVGNNLTFKVKYADGVTVKSGTVAIA